MAFHGFPLIFTEFYRICPCSCLFDWVTGLHQPFTHRVLLGPVGFYQEVVIFLKYRGYTEVIPMSY